LLVSLEMQSVVPLEILIADGSDNGETHAVVQEWHGKGAPLRYLRVSPPNAVRQRIAAIAQSTGTYLLLLDDDVALAPDCVEQMLAGMRSEPDVVAVVADFSNQEWSEPTRAWRWYMKYVLGLRDREWEGKVVGPLLRFCFPRDPKSPGRMEWIGAGTTLILRDAYDRSGGFSDFFLHRCTMNEDVDLGLKLNRVGKIVFWPAARLAHFHAPSGRVSPDVAAEDDLFNRYFVLTRTAGVSRPRALVLVTQFLLIESLSNLAGAVVRLRLNNSGSLLRGRLRGYVRLLRAARV
jgi:GT2 family glycosyltransferase